jgi:ubiquinone/menaquinone biosynthesis C-methylase UbiE
VSLIEIGGRNYLLYLILPHPMKVALLSRESRARLDRINTGFNERVYSGEGAKEYDRIHRYEDDTQQHEYPARALVSEVWGREDRDGSYGWALELGAGSGYFTALIARRARSVIAIEPVADLQKVVRERCAAERLDNVTVIDASAFDLGAGVPPASIDSAFIIQSLHHFHRRPEVFAELGRVVRPGGRLYLVEPHHNLRRVARLARKYRGAYRAREFRTDERNWATHDFLTRSELRALCRHGGFADVHIGSYWIPYSRRLIPSADRRFKVERILGRVPLVRHAGSVLAMEARRRA